MLDRPAEGAKVLVVDDAPQNVKLLRVILKDAGYQVAEALNGPEALASLRRERPDAMVLDVRMPGMTGYDVCRAVRADPDFATLPVIMLTALSQPEERIRGIEVGATDFISKPFNKRELLARLQTSLALARTPLGAVVNGLPGITLVVDNDWKVVALSPKAVAFLALPLPLPGEFDLLSLLVRRGIELPPADSLCGAPWHFALDIGGTRKVQGRCVPIRDAFDRPVLRVIVLTSEEPPAESVPGLRP